MDIDYAPLFKGISVIIAIVCFCVIGVAVCVQIANNSKGIENRIDWGLWTPVVIIVSPLLVAAYYLWVGV